MYGHDGKDSGAQGRCGTLSEPPHNRATLTMKDDDNLLSLFRERIVRGIDDEYDGYGECGKHGEHDEYDNYDEHDEHDEYA